MFLDEILEGRCSGEGRSGMWSAGVKGTTALLPFKILRLIGMWCVSLLLQLFVFFSLAARTFLKSSKRLQTCKI